jgi:amino acid transporter
MSPFSPIPHRHPIRVVLSSTALLPFMSVRKAAALAIAQLGVAAFFIAGISRAALGESAAWFVLAAAVLTWLVRAIDIESWALLIPGGLISRVASAWGPRAVGLAKAVALVERVLLGALASVVIGHYVASVSATAIAGWRFTGYVRPEDLATLVAVTVFGLVWLPSRIGRSISREVLARGVWIGVAILLVAVAWGLITLTRRGLMMSALTVPPPIPVITGWWLVDTALACVTGFALVLPVIGGGEALVHAAHELPPPRVKALRRTALVSVLFAALATTLGTFLAILLVPASEQPIWANAPLAGVAQHLAAPSAVRVLLAIAIAAASVLMLGAAVHAAVSEAEQMLHRSSSDGTLPATLTSLHTRFGTPAHAVDVTVVAMTFVVLASGGRVVWLSRAYAVAIAVMLVLTIDTLVRLRRTRRGPTPFKARGNVRFGGREVPVSLFLSATMVALPVVAMVLSGDPASIAAAGSIAVLALWFVAAGRHAAPVATSSDETGFDLLLAAELSPDHVEARPGNLLVPVRNPHLLSHVVGALHTAGDRDVVVMTARVLDVDVSEESAGHPAPTPYERRLLSDVVALAERVGRPVRLLIVPTRNVVDAIVGTVIRLRSSDVYVGESSSLSSEDQARLLGEAWERADKPDALDVRLVIYHRSGRADTYHLGAHPPSLTSADLDLIHRLWLDAVKTVGPHVHHDDVVRAALKQMEQQLSGPQRDEAVAALREEARPAEELAEVLRARDYARLRDILRNRHGGDVASLLTALSLEDQVVVFRVMPRKDAAAVFGYLSQESKEALLKAMAQEDVAALLNDMAPDDRTLFLEELPAEATRQLLSLLTPAERAVAVKLLGYP